MPGSGVLRAAPKARLFAEPPCRLHVCRTLNAFGRTADLELLMCAVEQVVADERDLERTAVSPSEAQRQLGVAWHRGIGQRRDGADGAVKFELFRQIDERAHPDLIPRVVVLVDAQCRVAA